MDAEAHHEPAYLGSEPDEAGGAPSFPVVVGGAAGASCADVTSPVITSVGRRFWSPLKLFVSGSISLSFVSVACDRSDLVSSDMANSEEDDRFGYFFGGGFTGAGGGAF